MQQQAREQRDLRPALLDLLACPQCKGALQRERDGLICATCGAGYEICDGIPILSVDRHESAQQLDRQRRIFDPQYSRFETYALENWRRSYLERIFGALGIRAGASGTYLDIGAGGSGYTVIEAARLGFHAVGVDLSVVGVQKAARFAEREGVADRTSFVVGGAEALPFRNEAFDAVSSIAVIEHLVRDDLAAGEIARVARAASRLFVTVPHTFLRTNLLLWLPYYLHDRSVGHLRHYTAKRLARLFAPYYDDLEPRYSGRTTKALQLLLERLGLSSDDRWWAIERLDLMHPRSPWGAQLHMTGTRSPRGLTPVPAVAVPS